MKREGRSDLYLPSISGPGVPRPVADALMAFRLGDLFAAASWQQRVGAHPDALLFAIAQAHAEDMLLLRYFSHVTPAGVWSNSRVRAAGYALPDWYADGENNVESIGLNYRTPEEMLSAWSTNQTHWQHIAALHDFFKEQTAYGVGFVTGPADAGLYWVLLSAPPF